MTVLSQSPRDYLDQISFKIRPVFDQPLDVLTSVRVGGKADYFFELTQIDEIVQVLRFVSEFQLPFFIMGKGTNLLVPDSGFRGAVIKLGGDFKKMALQQDRLVSGAGVSDQQLARFAKNHALGGLEFLKTIPGSVGGAVYMNAGAHGESVGDRLKEVRTLDLQGNRHNYSIKELDLAYRRSRFSDSPEIILEAEFELTPKPIDEIQDKENRLLDIRKKTQPVGKKTWGSVFKNPANASAGRLIEELGFKGKSFGGAMISEKHANFIENKNGASFEDLLKAIDEIKQSVFNKYGIELETEGRILRNLFK
ncbi:MAG: UDP-N-acetylmuramate dehydrogenase [Deltaproteobacteria bacterium]|nr:UDP-N-acetylmuramate dehydrogenase [Deltaproteobacteria bacterium]